MRRLVVWGVLFLLVVPVSWAVVGWMKKPALYAGDKLEYRTCRECGGSGVEAGGEGPVRAGDPCIACRGKKQVAVIVPGPNHPVKVRGEVFDAKARPGETSYEAAALEMLNHGPTDPVRGAVSSARVVFTQGEQKVEVTTNGKGRFTVALPSGEWKYTVTADGFSEATGDLSVPALQQPIWQEEAHIKRPDESEGLVCPVAL